MRADLCSCFNQIGSFVEYSMNCRISQWDFIEDRNSGHPEFGIPWVKTPGQGPGSLSVPHPGAQTWSVSAEVQAQRV